MSISALRSFLPQAALAVIVSASFNAALADDPYSNAQFDSARREKLGSTEAAAEVNGRVILRREVELITAARAGDDLGSLDKEDIKSLKHQVIEDLIDRSLLLEAARAAVAPPPPAEVQRALAEVSEKGRKLPLYIGQASEDTLKSGYKDDLWIRTFLGSIDSTVDVKEEEIRSVYNRERLNLKEPEQFHLKQILLAPDPGVPRETLIQEARDMAEQIRLGQISFDDAVKQYSTGPARDRGGDIGFVSANQISGDMLPLLQRQPLNVVTDPVESSNGVHLMLVLERRGGTIPELTQVHDSIKAQIAKYKRDQIVAKLLIEKRREAKIIHYLE